MKPQTRTNQQHGSKLRLLLLLTICLFAFATAAQAATFTVTTATDNGNDANPTPGSLRKAIIDANNNPGADTINFNISGAGVHTISPTAALPTITDPVTIDGYTQPGASVNTLPNGDNAVLLIELTGTNPFNLSGSDGLVITAGSSTIKGIIINGFAGNSNYSASGILLSGKGGNVIAGNFIGIDRNGTVKIPNAAGVSIKGSSDNVIGGPVATRNVISGNSFDGVYIAGQGAKNNYVVGNFIGTDRNGKAALGNGARGVEVYGVGTTASAGKIGGTNAGDGNVISGNGLNGIEVSIDVSGMFIQGNLIGTDVTGKAALGNGGSGIWCDTATVTQGVIIGGNTAGARNIISANKFFGITINTGPGIIIQGNYIGTDITGNAALGNVADGIFTSSNQNTVGGGSAGEGNVISANGGVGLGIANGASSTFVEGNLIGYGADGVTALGNKGDGIRLVSSASNNSIGGQGKFANSIAFNGGAGIKVTSGVANNISANSISSNAGLGIDIEAAGVTPNDAGDADTGPNNLQNYPVITSATTSGTVTVIQGTLNSTPHTTFHLEFFANSQPDSSGYGEGETFIGSSDIPTNGNGDANFNVGLSGIPNGQYISATATDPAGNTSEFSLCAQLNAGPPQMFIGQTNLPEGNSGTKTASLNVTISHASSSPVTVEYATVDDKATAPSDYTAASGKLTFAPGETSKTVTFNINGDTQFEPDENFLVKLSNPTNAVLSIGTGIITINNDDAQTASMLQFSAQTYSVNEKDGQASVTVKRTGGSLGAVSVQYATVAGGTATDSDYLPVSGTLTWADGDSADKTFAVLVVDDMVGEQSETINLALSNPTGGASLGSPNTALITILNDGDASETRVQFSSATYTVNEGLVAVTIMVTRTGDTADTSTVDYATSDGTATQKGDYEIASGTVTFAPGETAQSFDVLINQDSYSEGNETINLTLSNGVTAELGQPSTAVLTIIDDAVENASNPNDEAQSFVHQQYHDFLNREPDAGGLDYWTSEITKCGADQTCIDNRRKDVSAAFYMEMEFQETGYFVYRMEKAALGTQPTYQQFMRDRSRIMSGPKLSQSQQDFAASFVQRQEFMQMYPAAMSADGFVNKLYDTAGLVPYAQERQQQMAAMQNGKSRVEVVRDVIEIPEFRQREYNPSFVLMQYFGYLRRDPDAAGYQFWLNVLNAQVPNDLSGYHAIVCAFITSAEYQDRFSALHTHSNVECGQ